jgi:hypothetical protein
MAKPTTPPGQTVTREEFDALAERVSTLETRANLTDDRMEAVENRTGALEAQTTHLTNVVDEVVANVEDLDDELETLGERVTALEQEAGTEPEPPDPEPPEPGTLVDLCAIKLPATGHISQRVNLPPGKLRTLGNVWIGEFLAQADHVCTDDDGWVRSFTLARADTDSGLYIVSGEQAAGRKRRRRGRDIAPGLVVHVTVDGAAGTLASTVIFRAGLEVEEQRHRLDFPGGLRAYVHQRIWHDGTVGATVVFENGWSKAGQHTAPDFAETGPKTRSYDAAITLGLESYQRRVDGHYPYGRWVHRIGPQAVDAWVLPLDWTGDDDQGAWLQLQQSRVLMRYIDGVDPGPPNMAVFDNIPDEAFPVCRDANGHPTGWLGPYSTSQGSPGDNPDIGQEPHYFLSAMRHLSKGGWQMLRNVLDLRQGLAFYLRAQDTDGFHRPDETTTTGQGATIPLNYVFDGRWTYGRELIGTTADPTPTQPNQWLEDAHVGNIAYVLWAVLGELLALETLSAEALWHFAVTPFVGNNEDGSTADPAAPAPPHPNGYGMLRHGFMNRRPRQWDCGDSSYSGHPQERAMGYHIRATTCMRAVTPDDEDLMVELGLWPQHLPRVMWENVCNAAHNYAVVGRWDLSNEPIDSYHTSEERWPLPLFRHTHAQTKDACVSWMQGIIWISLCRAWDRGGLMPATGTDHLRWLLTGVAAAVLDPDFRWDWIVGSNICGTLDRINNWWDSAKALVYDAQGQPVLNPDGSNVTYGQMGYGKPAMTNAEVYAATFRGHAYADVPPGTPRDTPPSNSDWEAYYRDVMLTAVAMGVPRAQEALDYLTAYAQRWEHRDYQYGMQHALALREAS